MRDTQTNDESILNSPQPTTTGDVMNWKDEFDIHFNEDTLVSAHNKWTPDLIKEFIESLLKQQRENCSKFLNSVYDSTEWVDTKSLRNAILNAPEPTGEKK